MSIKNQANIAGSMDFKRINLKFATLIFLALAAFSLSFVLVDNAYYKFADARFPNVGTSPWLATLWGVVSRAHLLILMIPLVAWKPRLFGLQIGKTWQYGRMILVMLLVNCGVIAAYLWLTSSTTPYSGNQWLVTEVITVPVVEETFWRGLVFTTLQLVLQKIYSASISNQLTVWISGLVFGLLHAGNMLANVPALFVAIQVLNATIGGVVYGYARAKTESIYPPILLHAAMNLIVILF
jgi:membrane protease YdiL (CAAX protease family)